MEAAAGMERIVPSHPSREALDTREGVGLGDQVEGGQIEYGTLVLGKN